jgi:hypothetical protein
VSGRIRARIAAGLLPITSDPSGRLWVGKGGGRSCDGGDELIAHEQTEYEVDVSMRQTLRFYTPCLDAWLAECHRG